MRDLPMKNRKQQSLNIGAGVALCVVMGLMVDSIAMGIGIGIAIGIAFSLENKDCS
jgi:hypothetical protein